MSSTTKLSLVAKIYPNSSEENLESREVIIEFLTKQEKKQEADLNILLNLRSIRLQIHNEMVKIASCFTYSLSTFLLALRMLDKCLVKGIYPGNEYLEFSCALLWIASKYNDRDVDGVAYFRKYNKDILTARIRKWELKVCQTTKFDFGYPCVITFAIAFLKLITPVNTFLMQRTKQTLQVFSCFPKIFARPSFVVGQFAAYTVLLEQELDADELVMLFPKSAKKMGDMGLLYYEATESPVKKLEIKDFLQQYELD